MQPNVTLCHGMSSLWVKMPVRGQKTVNKMKTGKAKVKFWMLYQPLASIGPGPGKEKEKSFNPWQPASGGSNITVQIDIGTVEVGGRSHLNTTHSQHYGTAKARPTIVPKLV
jgi:hypothetical protein